jgi:small-conductance mechanosensitive channel
VVANLIMVVILFALSLGFGAANQLYGHQVLINLAYTSVGILITYILFKYVIEKIVSRAFESKARYYMRKLVSIGYFSTIGLIIMTIWVNPQVFVVGFGVMAAGIAVALQDFFKNLAGGLLILITRIYSVGDRIEINSKIGDVIDIDIFYTTILEIQGWVSGDQATGRMSIIPNGMVLSGIVNNYSKDHEFIWDELHVPLTYDSNWRMAHDKFIELIEKETKDIIKQAEKEMEKLEKTYFMTKRETKPQIFVRLTDNWISLTIRYITPVRQRRATANKISRLIINEIEKSKGKLKVSSQTSMVSIMGFPEIKMKK